MTSTTSAPRKVTTLIFDVDDTLYDVSTGFTTHRNGPMVQQFMVDRLGFESLESAKKVRDFYFEKYHATAKALTVAEQEGAFPPLDDESNHHEVSTTVPSQENAASYSATTTTKQPQVGDPSRPRMQQALPQKPRRFQVSELAAYWATHLDYSLLGGPRQEFLQDLSALNDAGVTLVAFSNGPRQYVEGALEALGLRALFSDSLFCVDDVLPYCKPEAEAFDVVLQHIGKKASECIMVEDSMKNVRAAKALGMGTVLIVGKGGLSSSTKHASAAEAEATKPGDAPIHDDPAVDVALETVDEMRSRLPGLWESPAVFQP